MNFYLLVSAQFFQRLNQKHLKNLLKINKFLWAYVFSLSFLLFHSINQIKVEAKPEINFQFTFGLHKMGSERQMTLHQK